MERDATSEFGDDATDARQATSLLASFLRDHSEDIASFEALCSDHPDLAPALRVAFAGWKAVREVLGGSELSPSFAEALAQAHAEMSLADGEDGDYEHPSTNELRELFGRLRPATRYEVRDRIAGGGMGTVSSAWDSELQRFVAMKVLTGDPERDGRQWTSRLARFLDEAQVTGQLDHPGIVPVHELGVDDDGRVFFTMKLVRGETLARVIKRVHAGEGEWTLSRVLFLLLKLCEAMSYAHAKRVLHRDLKPANIMIGRFGEVYVMDWGLARVLGPEDHEDSDLAPPVEEPADDAISVVHSLRSPEGTQGNEERQGSSHGSGSSHSRGSRPSTGSPLVTEEGSVLGTPAFMSPEQAAGAHQRLGPRSDVYSFGAILYNLLTGRVPYVAPGTKPRAAEIWERVRAGAPQPVAGLLLPSLEVPDELVAICEKAMARDPFRRYASFDEVRGDLQAYLDGRAVSAHRRGPVVELKKWVQRNRLPAALLGAVLGLAVVGTGLVARSESLRAREANASERRISGLLDTEIAANLVAEADELWPVHPDTVPRMDAWLREAHALVERTTGRRAAFEALRARALPGSTPDELLDADESWVAERAMRDAMQELLELFESRLDEPEGHSVEDLGSAEEGVAILGPEIERRTARIEARKRELARTAGRSFELSEDAERYREELPFAADIARLTEAPDDLIAAIEERRELSRTLPLRTLEDAAQRWDAALAAIADGDHCPLYGGLTIPPQLGLVPLERNAASGLWEFWHVLSGERPERGDDGAWDVRPETGLVFVLVPGGAVTVGAQAHDPDALRYDPDAGSWEGPPTSLVIGAYLISKYEMTQAQWARLTGEFPSHFYIGNCVAPNPRVRATHPVEHVSHDEAVRATARWNMILPAEAQWETAARAGTDGPFWFGEDCVESAALLNTALGDRLTRFEAGPDGFTMPGPVDAWTPNAFGLFNPLGNVSEWCRDAFSETLSAKTEEGTGELLPAFFSGRARRGGSFRSSCSAVRVAFRSKLSPYYRGADVGVRPSIELAPSKP